jgi:hypothetical protein
MLEGQAIGFLLGERRDIQTFERANGVVSLLEKLSALFKCEAGHCMAKSDTLLLHGWSLLASSESESSTARDIARGPQRPA